jgi:hypothetical protein
MPRPWVAAAASVVVALGGCAKDSVLPDTDASPSVCGDGVVEPGEQCDNMSLGCMNCQTVPGWNCNATTNVCTPICGDGLVMAPDGTCSIRDTACDMTGYWAARESDYTADTVIGSIQASSAWSLFHFVQTGNDFHVVEELDCGVHVTGSATVDFTPASFLANMYLNRQDGVADDAGVAHAARHGTSAQVAGGCAVTLDPWYKLRGATDAYLPADFTNNPPLSSLMPLPAVMSYEPDSGEWPDGATDPDNDHIPGIAYQISGLISATREAVERQWQGYATPAGAPVPASAVTLVLPDGYDDQESVMRVLGCSSGGCTLAAAGSVVSKDNPGHITLAFIGKTYGSSRVAPVVMGVPRQNASLDQTTCANVKLLLPHIPCPAPCASDAGLSPD